MGLLSGSWIPSTSSSIGTFGSYTSPYIWSPVTEITYGRNNQTKTRPKEASPAGQYIPIPYGRCKVQGLFVYLKQIGDIHSSSTRIHGIWVFGEGEMEEYESLLINGKLVSTYSNVTVEYYKGTATQTVCSLNDYDPTFTDAMEGYPYAYIRFGMNTGITEMPTVEAVGKWKKVYDPRNSSTGYSSNPALVLADIHTNPNYGNSPIDWNSVASCADYCDELIGVSPDQQKRYEFNYCFTDGNIKSAMDFVKVHFLGNIYPDRSTYTMHTMKPKSPVATFDEYDDNGKKQIWDLMIPAVESQDMITRIKYSYTDPEIWDTITAPTLDDPLIATNQAEVHEATYDLTGCNSFSQAKRIATALINMRLSDLFAKFSTHNSYGLQPWDVFYLTHSLGLSNKQMFCTKIDANEDGSFTIEGREYDPAFFSDTVETEPTWPDTNLPDPDDTPPDVLTFELTEELTQLKDSTWISIVKATWTDEDWQFLKHFEVWYKVDDGDYQLINITTGNTYELRAIQELSTYTFKIVAVSFWDKKSDGVERTIIPQGKYLVPTWKDGAGLVGIEAGDIVILRWYMPDYTAPAIDIDIAGYEIRRGSTSDTWDSAVYIAFIDALVYTDKNCPGGTWRYFLKAKDSVGGYTEIALTADVVVTLNPYSTFQHDRFFDVTTMTGSSIALCLGDIVVPIHASYDTLGERFPGTNIGDGVGGTYSYLCLPSPTSADGTTTAIDIGQIISGEWSLSYSAQKLGTGTASITPKLCLSVDNVIFTEYDASVPFSAVGRYAKAKFVFASSSLDTTHILSGPIYTTVFSEPKEEFGEASVPSSGGSVGVAAVVFTTTFLEIEKIILTPLGNVPRIACADNLTTIGFDLCLFSTAGVPAGGDCKWLVEGF
jgi:hypothetical protein